MSETAREKYIKQWISQYTFLSFDGWTCSQLAAKDAEIARLRQRVEELERGVESERSAQFWANLRGEGGK